MNKNPSEDDTMDVDAAVEFEQFDDDINTDHEHFSHTSTTANILLNRELLSKLIVYETNILVKLELV